MTCQERKLKQKETNKQKKTVLIRLACIALKISRVGRWSIIAKFKRLLPWKTSFRVLGFYSSLRQSWMAKLMPDISKTTFSSLFSDPIDSCLVHRVLNAHIESWFSRDNEFRGQFSLKKRKKKGKASCKTNHLGWRFHFTNTSPGKRNLRYAWQ